MIWAGFGLLSTLCRIWAPSLSREFDVIEDSGTIGSEFNVGHDLGITLSKGQFEVASPPSFKPKITIDHCEKKGYSVVTVRCKDFAKLMFDIVCTLTDMQYVIFHASISTDSPYTSQVFL